MKDSKARQLSIDELDSISGGRSTRSAAIRYRNAIFSMEGKYCSRCGALQNIVKLSNMDTTMVAMAVENNKMPCSNCYYQDYKTLPISQFVDTPPTIE